MYTIRVNDNCVIREYTTDTYFNATATCSTPFKPSSARCKCSAVMAYSNLKPFKEIQPCVPASSLFVTHFVHKG
jgi:hypothetical protein